MWHTISPVGCGKCGTTSHPLVVVEGIDILDRDADQLRGKVGLDPHRQAVTVLQSWVGLRTVVLVFILVHHLDVASQQVTTGHDRSPRVTIAHVGSP